MRVSELNTAQNSIKNTATVELYILPFLNLLCQTIRQKLGRIIHSWQEDFHIFQYILLCTNCQHIQTAIFIKFEISPTKEKRYFF